MKAQKKKKNQEKDGPLRLSRCAPRLMRLEEEQGEGRPTQAMRFKWRWAVLMAAVLLLTLSTVGIGSAEAVSSDLNRLVDKIEEVQSYLASDKKQELWEQAQGELDPEELHSDLHEALESLATEEDSPSEIDAGTKNLQRILLLFFTYGEGEGKLLDELDDDLYEAHEGNLLYILPADVVVSLMSETIEELEDAEDLNLDNFEETMSGIMVSVARASAFYQQITDPELLLDLVVLSSDIQSLIFDDLDPDDYLKEAFVAYATGEASSGGRSSSSDSSRSSGGSSGGSKGGPSTDQTYQQPPQKGALVTFNDVQNHWAQQEIETLASLHIVRARDNGLYDPESFLTRAQFAAMLVRAFGLKEDPSLGVRTFGDTTAEDWYAGIAGAVYQHGIMTGSNGAFVPNRNVTRLEMAVMLSRVLKVAGKEVPVGDSEALLSSFADANEVTWGHQEMAQMIQMGVIRGDGEGRLKPLQAATRAQAAVMLFRYLHSI